MQTRIISPKKHKISNINLSLCLVFIYQVPLWLPWESLFASLELLDWLIAIELPRVLILHTQTTNATVAAARINTKLPSQWSMWLANSLLPGHMLQWEVGYFGWLAVLCAVRILQKATTASTSAINRIRWSRKTISKWASRHNRTLCLL